MTTTIDDLNAHWAALDYWAEMFEDAQKARISAENKAQAAGHWSAVASVAHLDALRTIEHQAELTLGRAFKAVVPVEIQTWQAAERGVGRHLLARLLGQLGDPMIAQDALWINDAELPADHKCAMVPSRDGTSMVPAHCGNGRHLVILEPRERTLRQLWSYCGHGDASRRLHKGMTQNELMRLGSPKLKMLTFLLATACLKQPDGNHYRDIYVAARAKYADKLHDVECVRCGPSGKPAQPGSPWNPGHQHATAIRLVGKELLRDMWRLRRQASGLPVDPR